MFSSHSVNYVISTIGSFLPSAEQFLRVELEKQKHKLYNAEATEENPALIQQVWNWIVTLMIAYFIYAFLNAIIQNKLEQDAKKKK
jgi:hypothetical protein